MWHRFFAWLSVAASFRDGSGGVIDCVCDLLMREEVVVIVNTRGNRQEEDDLGKGVYPVLKVEDE